MMMPVRTRVAATGVEGIARTPFPMEAEALAQAIDIPLERWPLNCHGIASAVKDLVPVEGMRVCRGHWWGRVSSKSAYRCASPLQHSWLVLADGRILDPTRWAMERPGCPEIYIGENDVYDEAGCELRQRARAVGGLALAGGSDLATSVLCKAVERVADRGVAEEAIRTIGSEYFCPDALTGESLEGLVAKVGPVWKDVLAKAPEDLRDARSTYQAAADLGLKAHIQIDLWLPIMDPGEVYCRTGTNRVFEVPAREELYDAGILLRLVESYLSLEARAGLETELDELGVTLDAWDRAVSNLAWSTKAFGQDAIEMLDEKTATTLALGVGDFLGAGIGMELRVTRHAASLGADRHRLNKILEDLGERAGVCMGW